MQDPGPLAHTPFTHAPQSHWASVEHMSGAHPCPATIIVHLVLSGHRKPAVHGIGSHPVASAEGDPALQR
jgi:hypothetical protein